MKSTYLNDAYSSTYPFVSDTDMPFPMYCIVGAGFCIRPKKKQPKCPVVYLTSIEITANYIKAYVCLDTYKIGQIECTPNEQHITRLNTDDWDITAWLVPGVIDDICIGSYATKLKIDSNCIEFMPDEYYGSSDTIRVNGIQYSLPEQISLSFTDLLSVQFSNYNNKQTNTITNEDLDVNDNNEIVVEIRGNPVDGLTIVDTYDKYNMVSSVNGIQVVKTPAYTYHRTLEIIIKAPEGKYKPSDYIHILTDRTGLLDYSSIDFQSDITGEYNERSPSIFNDYGTVGNITLAGTTKIPNCYGTTDDADAFNPLYHG